MATITEDSTTLSNSKEKASVRAKLEGTPLALDASSLLAQSPQFWHKSTPRKLVAAQQEAAGEVAWSAWQKHLKSRSKPELPEQLSAKRAALLWGLESAVDREHLAAWIKLLNGMCAAKSQAVGHESLVEWLAIAESRLSATSHALEALAVAYRLPQLAKHLPAELWWQLIDGLFAMVQAAQLQTLDEEVTANSALDHQLLSGELALALAYQFPEIEPLRDLRKSASQSLSESLVGLLDGEGVLHARHLQVWRALFACWTRCQILGQNWKKGCWSSEAQTQYEWLIRESLRLTRPDGSRTFAGESEGEWSPSLFAAAIELAGDHADRAAADGLLPKGVLPKKTKVDQDETPEPENRSEWAGIAVLASDWLKTSPRISIAYGEESPPQLEIFAGRDLLVSGPWQFELTCDGKAVTCDQDWEEQCWQTDEECDFLELSVELSHGLTLERQLLLAHDDEILYLADNVLSEGTAAHKFEYRAEIPLSASVAFEAEKETRDGILTANGKTRAALFPLALPEWRSDPRFGELTIEDERLVVTHKVTGKNFCSPIVFDLKPRRSAKPRTWRQLTVADQLEAQPHDVAAGFRVQSGKDQWLFYRSLAMAGNRTLMGHNLSSEFFAGRFLSSGIAEEILEIDAGDE